MSVDFNGIGPGQVNTQKTTADKSSATQSTQPSTAEQAKTQAQGARGENVNLSKHGFKVEIKSPTFHDMRIKQNGNVVMRYLLDL